MKSSRHLRSLFAGMVALAAAGCAQVPLAEAPLAKYALPTPLATTQINLPIDAIRVAAAIVDRLHGGTGAAAGVTFSPDAGQEIDGSNAGLPGFDWRNTVIHQYTAPVDDPDLRVAAGELRFDDSLSRRAAILFTVEYTTVEPIEIRQVAVSPSFALDPALVVYVTPADAFDDVAPEVLASHGGLLAAVAEAAVSWRITTPTGDQDYLVFVFLMDQVSASAEFSVGVSSTERGASYGGAARYLEDGGWRAAVLPGRFSFGKGAPNVVVAFRTGSEVGVQSRRPRTIGIFPLDAEVALAAGGNL
jgi:hypothetical protein